MPIIYTYPSATPTKNDYILISDVSETDPANATRKCTLGDVVTLVGSLVPGGGTVSSVTLDFQSTGLTTGGAASETITNSGTFDVAGTLVAVNGGTGNNVYTVGDMLYADTTTTLSKLTFASAAAGNGDILTLDAGIPKWLTPGFVTQWTCAGDAGTPAVVTNTDTLTVAGGTDIGTIAANGPDSITINHSSVTNTPATDSATLSFGGTFDAITGVTVSAQGHLTAQNTRTYTMPSASITPIGFSPCPIAVSDSEITITPENIIYWYLTVAEHTMTLGKAKIWGSNPLATADIQVSIFRWGTGWGTGAQMGGVIMSGATYGPNEGTLAARAGQDLNVVAGENLIVAIRRNNAGGGSPWKTIGDVGLNDAMFGRTSTDATMPTISTGGGGGDPTPTGERWALTLYSV